MILGQLQTNALASVSLDGKVVQGGLLAGQAPPGSEVTIDGEPIKVSADGRFLIAFGRDDTASRNLAVTLPDGDQWQRRLRPDEREFDIQHIDGLPDEQVTPPDDVLERIRNEAALARRARERSDERTEWVEGFNWPTIGRITGVYGSQRILNGNPRAPHWGIDIAAPTGTPVKAPAAGIVTLTHDMYFSGLTIFLDHGHGLISSFLHLSEILVEEGQRIEQGELIGKVGATGRATGPHLDWRISLGDVRVDPALLLDWDKNPHADSP
ncbi:M23 family metallopeptidase [Wenzhouxiangella sp. AB-CW3]|nr:M23 family metallopeptidase [Wenzhouxiangella sp. AB-CW3]